MHRLSPEKIINYFFFLFLFFVAYSCKKDPATSSEKVKNVSDSLEAAKKAAYTRDSLEKAKITYETFIFPKNKKDSAMSVFQEKFSKDEQSIILALNRLDYNNKWRADTLSVPDKFDETLMIYSPFPRSIEQLNNVDKIVFFSYPIQAYALYEKGKLVKWGPSSMGKKTAQTKRGLMFANWKKELAISTVDSDWKLPYNFNIHNTLGIGWHEYDLPGYPASHSCLRLLREDAKYLYNWAEQWTLTKGGAEVKTKGTPVIVFGDYNWGGKKPWKYLSDDAHANDISLEVMNEIIAPHLQIILEEQEKRHNLKDSQTSSEAGI